MYESIRTVKIHVHRNLLAFHNDYIYANLRIF